MARIGPDERKRRLRIIEQGRDDGLSTREIAAIMGLKVGTLRGWIRANCPQHCMPIGAHKSPREHDRRRRIATDGRNAGRAWTEIAADMGIAPSTLETWLTRHAPDLRNIRPRRKPEPEPVPDASLPIRIHREQTGYLVACPRCRRTFMRRTRPLAHRLRDMHDRVCGHH